MKYLTEGRYKANPLPLIIGIDALVMLGILAVSPAIFAASIVLFFICIAQNTAFSTVSRSRNRDNKSYHALAAVFSNGIWLLTVK